MRRERGGESFSTHELISAALTSGYLLFVPMHPVRSRLSGSRFDRSRTCATITVALHRSSCCRSWAVS